MGRRILTPAFVLCALLATNALVQFVAPSALAQNMNQFQEEEIKDKEREIKKKKLADERRVEETKILSQPMTEEELEKGNLVEVEPNNVLPSDLTNVYRLLPYRVRRPKWGQQVTLTFSSYQPTNYQSAFANPSSGSYGQNYSATMPLFEFCYTYRYNSSIGGLGIDLAYGYFQANSNTLPATLTVQPIRVGGKYVLDLLFSEPYVAPYIMGGMYEALYSESQGGGSVTSSGNTQMALYYGAGLLFQLNWLDSSGSVESYNESGIENSYVFLEARQYQASSNSGDPDFSSNVVFGGGISLEF